MDNPNAPLSFYVQLPEPRPAALVVLSPDSGVWRADVSLPDGMTPIQPIRGMTHTDTFARAYGTVCGAVGIPGLQVLQERPAGAPSVQTATVPEEEAEMARLQAERLAAAERLARELRPILKRAGTLWSSAVTWARAMGNLDEHGAMRAKNVLELYGADVDRLAPLLEALDPQTPRASKRKAA